MLFKASICLLRSTGDRFTVLLHRKSVNASTYIIHTFLQKKKLYWPFIVSFFYSLPFFNTNSTKKILTFVPRLFILWPYLSFIRLGFLMFSHCGFCFIFAVVFSINRWTASILLFFFSFKYHSFKAWELHIFFPNLFFLFVLHQSCCAQNYYNKLQIIHPQYFVQLNGKECRCRTV